MIEKKPESFSDIVDRATEELRSTPVPPGPPPELLEVLLQAARDNIDCVSGNHDSLPIGAPKAQEALELVPKTSCGSSVPIDKLTGPPAEMIYPTLFTRSLTTWRWIMRSPVSRVAAAAIFVLAIAGVVFWFHGAGTTPAFADFLTPILEAKGVKYKMTVEVKGHPEVSSTSEVMLLDNLRQRQEMEMPDKSKYVQILDSSQGKQLCLFPATKQATILTLSNGRQGNDSKGSDPLAGFRSLLLDARNNPNIKREPLGEKEIDGRRVVGFHIVSEAGAINLWGDPKTGMPVRLEITMGMDGNMKGTMSDFELNVKMDESLFSIEPPPGYTIENQKVDNSPNEEKDLIAMFREYTSLTHGEFPDSLDFIKVSNVVWSRGNARIQRERFSASIGLGEGKADEELKCRIEEFLIKETAENQNEEQMRNIQKEMNEIVMQKEWEHLALGKWKESEEKRNEFEKLMLKLEDKNLNEEQRQKLGEDSSKFLTQMLWENIAPEKWKTNEEQRSKFEELFKIMEGNPNEEQMRKAKGEFREILGDEMLKSMEAWQAQSKSPNDSETETQETAKADEARSLKFMECQQTVHRGLHFADELPPEANAHYAGKGVSLGAADTPIFWYRPKDAKQGRVIYGDLSVKDVPLDQLPPDPEAKKSNTK
jgi:outer membrane lipoprotein-sorting protein